MEFKRLALAEIAQPDIAVRVAIDESKVDELAASIKVVGLLNPIVVRRVNSGYGPMTMTSGPWTKIVTQSKHLQTT